MPIYIHSPLSGSRVQQAGCLRFYNSKYMELTVIHILVAQCKVDS